MATLYVEGFPEDLYQALRESARAHRRSISAETICLLEQLVPTPAELKRRTSFYRRVMRLRKRTRHLAPGPSAEQLLREDRQR